METPDLGTIHFEPEIIANPLFIQHLRIRAQHGALRIRNAADVERFFSHDSLASSASLQSNHHASHGINHDSHFPAPRSKTIR